MSIHHKKANSDGKYYLSSGKACILDKVTEKRILPESCENNFQLMMRKLMKEEV